jgi:3-hydroxyisobutyrate dehydrogenase
MKLANNYTPIACMLATSEAIAYGERQGLSMGDMLEVMNDAAAESFVTRTLFPRHILTGAYDSAASAAIVSKDLALFVEEAIRTPSSVKVAERILETFRAFMEVADAREDWLRIYQFIRDADGADARGSDRHELLGGDGGEHGRPGQHPVVE